MCIYYESPSPIAHFELANTVHIVKAFATIHSFFDSQLIADHRAGWGLGSNVCLRFDNIQFNNIQSLDSSSRLCDYRPSDTPDFSHSERW